MLASTVQFSTYDQTPTRLHRQTRTSPRGQRRYDRRSAPTRDQRSARAPPDEPAPSGPNSVPTNRFPTTGLRSTHTRGHAVLGARDAGRPNWSAFHPRAPPHTPRRPPENGRPITVWARLCTTPSEEGGEVL